MGAAEHRARVEYRTPYMLRHTFATLLLNATQELAGVSAALGHADTEITARVYAQARRSATDYAATVRRVVEEESGNEASPPGKRGHQRVAILDYADRERT